MNNYRPIHGVFPAMLTMFSEDGALDIEATQRHADWLINQGVHGLVVGGTSGEFIALTDAERRLLITAVVEAVAHRVPVYAGTSCYTDSATIDLTTYAEKVGADGALLLPPYYMKPPKPAIISHFRAVRQQTNLPLMLYNNPAYAGTVELTAWDIADLVEDGVFQSIKHTFESPAGIHDLRYLCDEAFRVFFGGFRTALEGLAAGAHGWISGFINAFPDKALALYEAVCVHSSLQSAQAIWHTIIPFSHLYYSPRGLPGVNDLAIWRAVLDLRGQHGGFSRRPFHPLTDEQRRQVSLLLAKEELSNPE